MGKRRLLKAVGPASGLETSRIVVSRRLRLQTGPLYYCESGMGTPVIMIHGVGGSSRWWFRLFPALNSNDFRAVAPDLPGFGGTPGPALPLKQAAKAVLQLADHLKLDRFHLCGHSMGGAVAAHLAAEQAPRVRRLVLIDSAGIPAFYTPRMLGRLLQPWSWCPLRFYPTLVGDVIRAGPLNLARASRYASRADLRPTLQRITVPSLVIWGAKDKLIPFEDGVRVAEELPQARLESIEGARHLPMVSHPSEVGELLISFLRGSGEMGGSVTGNR